MSKEYTRLFCILSLILIAHSFSAAPTIAQNSLIANGSTSDKRFEDGWVNQRDEQTGMLVKTKELVLHPRAEPRPALKYRLLRDDFELTPGNAAIFYLKATGFFEQQSARERLSQFWKDAVTKANEEGKDIGQMPPYVWLDTPPGQLPLQQVKEYLQWTSFQPPILREAASRSHFDMDRNFREVENPIAYLLPEIQGLRELARNQSIRFRVAIAEGRIDDAIEITGQQFALGRHLGEDDFLVSNLVGIAIAAIGWNDALYLVQQSDCPNLYWALTTMPRPLVEIRRAMSIERQFLYHQLKVLREVDDTPRPAAYWRDFNDRLLPQLGYLTSEFRMPSVSEDPQAAKDALVGYIALAYPGAKQYLINEQKMPREQVEAYATAQVVFLAMVRFHDQWRDEMFKWTHVPIWQARSEASPGDLERALSAACDRYGWCTLPTQTFLPAILAVQTAAARCEQSIALLQAVEAVRMYAAAHDRKLPPSLDAVSVPAPIEPFTGKPVSYELLGDRAVLSGHVLPGMRYRLILRIAEKAK